MHPNNNIAIAAESLTAQHAVTRLTIDFMNNTEFIFSQKNPDASCNQHFTPPKYQMFEWVSWASEFKQYQHCILTGRVVGITWERKHFHEVTNHERKWFYTLETFNSEGKVTDYEFVDEPDIYLPVSQR
jgi:hypothetical protein